MPDSTTSTLTVQLDALEEKRRVVRADPYLARNYRQEQLRSLDDQIARLRHQLHRLTSSATQP